VTRLILFIFLSFYVFEEINAGGFSDAFNSVVRIKIVSRDGVKEGFGTGFFINNNQIVTNFHVVRNISKISLIRHYYLDEKEYRNNILINCVNPLYDLAVISVPNDKVIPHIDINKSASKIYKEGEMCKRDKLIEIGKKISVFNNSTNLKNDPAVAFLTSHGPLSDLFEGLTLDLEKKSKGECEIKGEKAGRNYNIYTYSKETVSGSSGSPVVDNDGGLIAVAVGETKDGAKNIAIPAEYVKEVMANCGPTKNITMAEQNTPFQSPIYKNSDSLMKANRKFDTDNIYDISKIKEAVIRGRVVATNEKKLKKYIKVELYQSINGGEKKVVADTDADRNTGKFRFEVKSHLNEKWYFRVVDDEYGHEGEGDYLVTNIAFTASQDVYVINKNVKGMVLIPDPVEIVPNRKEVTEGFTVNALMKGHDRYLRDRKYTWRLCEYPSTGSDCRIISKPIWIDHLDDAGRFGEEMNVAYKKEIADGNGFGLKRFDVKIDSPAGYDDVSKRISIFRINDYVYEEPRRVNLVDGEEGGKFDFDLPIKAILLDANDNEIGVGKKYKRRSGSSTLVYTLYSKKTKSELSEAKGLLLIEYSLYDDDLGYKLKTVDNDDICVEKNGSVKCNYSSLRHKIEFEKSE